MATRLNNAEGGTHGATVTQGSGGNSGGTSGDFFNVVSIGAGSTATFDNTRPLHGAMAYRISHASGTATTFEWNGYNTPTLTVRMGLDLDTIPTVTGFRPIDIRTAGGTSVGRILFNASGQMLFQTNNGGTTLKTWTTQVAADAEVRIEVTTGTGTAALKADLYLGDSTTPVETGYSGTVATGATDNITTVRWGSGSGIATSFVLFMDDLAAGEQTTYFGPAVPPAAPSAAVMTATGDAKAPGVEASTGVTGGGPMHATGAMPAPIVTGYVGGGTRVVVLLDDGTDTFPLNVGARVDLRSAVKITRGRGDQFETVEPSTLSWVMNNDDGALTSGPSALRVNQPVKVLVVAGGIVSTRFTGYITEWATSWPNGMDRRSVVTVSAVDDRARKGRRSFRPILEETAALEDPAYFYGMGEPERSTAAADTSGKRERPLTPTGTGAPVTFGAEGGPLTGGTAARFAGGQFLRRTLRSLIPVEAADYGLTHMTYLAAAVVTPTAAGNIIAVGDDEVGLLIELLGDGRVQARFNGATASRYGATAAAVTSPSSLVGETHLIAARWYTDNSPQVDVKLYVDGFQIGSSSVDVAGDLTAVTHRVTVGAQGFIGAVSGVMGWTPHFAFPEPRLERLTTAALDGFTDDTSSARLARYADLAGIPPGLRDFPTTPALTRTAALDTSGVTPPALMQQVADAEGGLLFVAGDGTWTLQHRHHRALKASPDLTLSAHDLGRETVFVGDLQGLVNRATVTRPQGEQQVVENAASIAEHGPHETSLEPAVTTDEEALTIAEWVLHSYSTTAPRVPDVIIDLLTQPPELQAAWLQRELSDRIRVTGLPSQTPAGTTTDQIIEGWTETISDTAWDVALNLSPFAFAQAWVLGDPELSVLGVTTRPTY